MRTYMMEVSVIQIIIICTYLAASLTMKSAAENSAASAEHSKK
jgi:hypothetical protein